MERPREISVSEFFEKNRHILGYSNPAKALVTCVKEAVDNSVTWDTPIIVKTYDGVKIVEIGKLIDEQFEKYKRFVERRGDLEKLRVFDEFEVLSFDSRYRLEFRRVSTLFRHKVNSKIYRVRLKGGRFVDLTDYHSVFTIVDGKIKPVKVSELKEGDWIVVPRKPWNCDKIKEINLIEEILKLPKELTKKVRIYKIKKIIDKVNLNVERRRINDFKKCDSMPIELLRELPKDKRKLFYNCYIGYKMSKYKLKCRLSVNRKLAEFLGLFVAKGSILKDLTRAVLSFGSHEKKLIDYTVNLIRRLFGIEPSVKSHETAVNVCIQSKTLGFILKYILKVGDHAKTKRIPPIVFQMNKEYREAFLIAYLAGDGYPTKEITKIFINGKRFKDIKHERVIFATSSKWLAIDMQYLLSSLGLNYSLKCFDGEERIIYGKRIKFSKSYTFYIYVKQKFARTSKIPVEVIASCNDPKLRYSISRSNQKFVFIDSLQGKDVDLFDGHLLDGDLGCLTVKKIEEIDYDKDWVYDLSVPDCENFTAGFGPILCHNSLDACEEAGILPDILVRITRVDKSVYRIVVEDNGPGIVEHQIPKIFGKLLYGSRFHVLKQSRGQQGLGISSAVLYAQLTTGKPTVVISKISPKEKAWRFELLIDTKRNEPEVVSQQQVDWHRLRGTRIELEVEGYYVKGRRRSVHEYLRQTSIVNPHVRIMFIEPDGQIHEFERVSYELPKIPKAIKPHPHGIELGTLLKMLKDTRSRSLKEFLKREFSRVGEKIAEEILAKSGIPNKDPRNLTRDEAARLMEAFKETNLLPPPTDCLSPIGEELIIKSLMKFKPEFVCAVSRKPKVYSGNPFLIEVGLAYGVKSDGFTLMRFANRIPLLYQQGGCALTKAVESVNWKSYGVHQDKFPNAPMVLMIHLASTNVPYTSESKEAIAEIPEIVEETRLALQEVGRKLKTFLDRKRTVQERKKKEKALLKIIPMIAKRCSEILERDEIDVSKVIARLTGKVYVEKSVEGRKVKIVVSNFGRCKRIFRLYDVCDNLRSWEFELKPFEEKSVEYECEKPSRSKPLIEGLDVDDVAGALPFDLA